MGCHNHKHTDGKIYFIPDCWGSVIYGKERCTCYDYNGVKLTERELIIELKKEIKDLKQQLKWQQKNQDISQL